MNICFIGGGNMGAAMIGGLTRSGVPAQNIRVVEISEEGRSRLQATGVHVFGEASPEAVQGADVVVLAVKPQQLQAVAIDLGHKLAAGQIVLSIAAGIRLTDLARWLDNEAANIAMVRAMPNTPALVGAGVTGLYSFPPATLLSPVQRGNVEQIIDAVGSFVWVNSEEEMDAVTAISGSGPAYVFYFIEALQQAGVELGLPEATARQLALETFLGAAKLAHESSESAATLRARVTSKNGTTERALLSMEANRVKQHIIEAAKAAALRSKELGDELGKQDNE
jgi:pyrroline-5-carboxylate reductase